jgi:hypothetical protein
MRIDSNLAVARQVRDTLNSISVRGDYVLGLLWVKTNASWSQSWVNGNIQTGEPYIDSLAEEFALQSVSEVYPAWDLFLLTFNPYLNIPKLAELYERHEDIIYAEISGYFGDGDDIELQMKNGAFNFVFSHGWGDCPSGCIERYNWYVAVEENVPTLEEEKYLNYSPYIFRWNIPATYDMTPFPDDDSILSAILFEPEWWVRKHAIEGVRLFFTSTSPWSGADYDNIVHWRNLRTALLNRRQLVIEVIEAALGDADEMVRESARKAYDSLIDFSCNKKRLDFGEVRFGTSKKDSIQINNTGVDTLFITSVTENIQSIFVSPLSKAIPPGESYFFTVTCLPESAAPIDCEIHFAHSRSATPIVVQVSGWGITQASLPVNVQSGWNLVSLPVRPDDSRTEILFPTAVSPAYSYQKNYVLQDTLTSTDGYWLKLDSAQTISLYGWQSFVETVEVNIGWNIIGSVSVPVAIGNITSIPENMTTSLFYSYNGIGYKTIDTILSGKAYWVKVSQSGKLILSPNGAGIKSAINIRSTSERPPLPPEKGNKEQLLEFLLEQNYPNPFNPVTVISYELKVKSAVILKVFDMLGREVATLLNNESKEAGRHETTFDASKLPSGVYFYKLQTGEFSAVRKLLLMR